MSTRHFTSGRQGVYDLLKFLKRPEVDIHFTLEDVFGTSDRAGYRLFAEGIIRRARQTAPFKSTNDRFNMAFHAQALEQARARRIREFPLQVHVTVRSLGIYRCQDHGLAEHWATALSDIKNSGRPL
jgi:hypothetical protein